MKKRVIATLAADSVDADARTVDVEFYTGAVVARNGGYFGDPYDLVIDVAGMDLSELNGGTSPVLRVHGRYRLEDVLGNVVEGSASKELGEVIDASEGVSYVSGRARATLRYAKVDDIEPIWQRVAQGAARNVSMGVSFAPEDTVTVGAKQRLDGGTVDLVIARRSKPYEISAVPLGADPGARTLSASGEDEPDPIADRIRTRDRLDRIPEGAQTMSTQTDPTPAAQATAPVAVPTPVAVDTAKLTREAEAAGSAKAFERLAICRQVAGVTGYPADKIEALAAGDATEDEIRKTMVEYAASLQPQIGGDTRVEHVDEGSDRLALAIEGAVYRRVGPELFTDTYEDRKYDGRRIIVDAKETARVRKAILAGREFATYPVQEMARKILESAGWDTGRMSMSEFGLAALKSGHQLPAELSRFRRSGATLAMSSSDFPAVLRNAGTKLLVASYLDAPAFYEQLSWRYDVKNFQTFYLPQRGDVPPPELVLEGGEYKRMILGEREQSGQVQKKGLILPFTEEMLVNDELEAFSERALEIVGSFRSEEQDTWVDLIADPANLGDGVAVYSAAYHTLTGTGGAPSIDSAALVEKELSKQRGINGKDGRPKNLPLFAVVGPTDVKRGLKTVFGPVANYPDATTNQKYTDITLPNERIYTDARFDDYSATAWYGMANPALAPVIAYGFIRGMEGLRTATRNGFDVDGLEIKTSRVMHFTQVGRVGIVKNAGQ